MAKLYGTVTNEAAKQSTRPGNREITAAAQSWEGSITACIQIDTNGHHSARIGVSQGSADEPERIIWQGPLSLLIRSTRLLADTQSVHVPPQQPQET